MEKSDKIQDDPRIMKPLTELLQKIREILGPPQAPTETSNTHGSNASEPKTGQ